MSKRTLFFAVVALQVLALFGMIGFKYSVLLTGRTVVLRSVPLDPRDLLRGDFVRIRWAISTLDQKLNQDGVSFSVGSDIYVVLKEGKPEWKPVRVSDQRPDHDTDQAIIKGRILEAGTRLIRVDYVMDSYYFPEGRGREFERIRLWEVSVDRRGNAVLKGPVNK